MKSLYTFIKYIYLTIIIVGIVTIVTLLITNPDMFNNAQF